MMLLLDQGLPRSTVAHLAARGIAAEHVGHLGMARATDNMILDAARQMQAAVVTLDADFHRLLATQRATTPSVVRIRIEGLKGDELARVIEGALIQAGTEIATGAAVSVTETRIRVRLLPVGRV